MSPTFYEGGDFYLPPAGAEGLGTQSSGGGIFLRRMDATGERYGIVVIQERAGNKKNGINPDAPRQSLWRAGCECGGEIVAPLAYFRRGYITSCGCIKKTGSGIKNGATSHGKETPEYNTWRCMKSRCFNKNNVNYKNYGGRGITVCYRWLSSFENFLSDMGKKPGEKYSIDRINNDGDYEKDNCHWATQSQQANNKRPRKTGGHNG